MYSNGFPPILGRGVDAHYGDTVTLEYTNIYSTVVPYYGDVVEGTGYIEFDPDYNDPDNGDYDISPTSPCQAGDPSFDDWDDTPGDGSRMGCCGGPGGERDGGAVSKKRAEYEWDEAQEVEGRIDDRIIR